MKQWYEKLFENYAKAYDKEVFTQGTLQEVDFIESEIKKNKELKILDIGCGTGRHSIELAIRGYNVTGVDLSKAQLNAAREKAEKAGTDVDFIEMDARDLTFDNEFDLAIMLCEGGFSLMETDEMNFAILQSAHRALNPKGKFIFTCLNALYPLKNETGEFLNVSMEGKTENDHFDLLTFRFHSSFTFTDDDGNESKIESNERFYAPSEISWQLSSLGFKDIEIFGCQIGDFSRDRNLRSDDFEMMAIAQK